MNSLPDSASTAAQPAGDFDYTRFGDTYARMRRPDPWIASLVHRALGDARTVINVGAGTGSYEPADRYVTPIEPSPAMRRQRSPESAPALDARAESLPYDNASFDAAMALLTVHQWRDLSAGIAEIRRVTRYSVVILTIDARELDKFWLASYVPEVIAVEQRRFPPIETIACELGGDVDIATVPIRYDCSDGFSESYYGRPEAFLRPEVRAAQSGWMLADPDAVARGIRQLETDLATGEWDRRHGHLRTATEWSGALRIIVAR